MGIEFPLHFWESFVFGRIGGLIPPNYAIMLTILFFSVPLEKQNKSCQDCNYPLLPLTYYRFKVRIFTTNGFRDVAIKTFGTGGNHQMFTLVGLLGNQSTELLIGSIKLLNVQVFFITSGYSFTIFYQ